MKNKCFSTCIFDFYKKLFSDRGLFLKPVIVVFLIQLPFFSAGLFGQQTLINLSVQNEPMHEVLASIENQSDYFVLYNNSVVDVDQLVTIELVDVPIVEALNRIFSGTQISYEFVDQQIVLNSEIPQEARTVRGIIHDEEGLEVIGASVVIKGTTRGVISDFNGNFSIELPPGKQVLVFSYVGMVPREVTVTNQKQLNIQMENAAEELDEVVVIGYGVQKKVDLTGSVSVVNGDAVNNAPVIGVDQAIQGRISGVRITQTTGQPGENVFVRIRGVGTIGDNDPLYIVDGVPTKDGMNMVSPSEIESISILKDASSAAIYGARSANGVVLITTKKGKTGEPKVNYNGYFGVQTHGKLIEMANTHEYVNTYNEAVANDNALVTAPHLKRDPIPFDPDTLANVDYMEEIFRPAITHSHQFSISGGSEFARYNLSFDYLDQQGIIKATDYKRYKFRTSVSTQVSDKIRIGTNMNIVNSNRNLITSSGHFYGAVRYAILRTSAIPIKDENGKYVDLWEHYKYFGDGYNPVGILDKYDNNEKVNRALGNLFVEYDIIENLRFKSDVGLDAAFGHHKQFTETWGTNNRIGYPGSAMVNDYQSVMLNWVNTLNYSISTGDHFFNILLGNEALKNTNSNHSGSDSRYEDQDEIFRYLGLGLNEMKGVSEGYSAWALLSYFSRAEYIFGSKYLLSANIRRDGSSRFSEDLKYGTFFSGSMGWRIDKEDFFEAMTGKVSMLKVRVSAGQLGNQEIGIYPTASTYGSGFNYVFGSGNSQDLVLGYAAISRGNDKIKWETTTQYDAGIDAAFFKNKLSITADYFLKTTADMLVKAPVSAIGGSADAPFVNAGSVRNHGLELELSYRDTKGALNYNFEGNFSYINNEVLSLGSGQPILGGEIDNGTYAARTAPGYPIGAFYMLEMEGIFQNPAEIFSSPFQGDIVGPGDVKYADNTPDFVIDEKDRVYVGSPIPKFTYGFSADFTFRSFDFTVFFQGVYGNKIYMQIGKDIEGFYRNLNITKRYVEEHWRPDYPSNIMPRASWYASTNNIRPSTRFLFDGSYLRLKNAQLGYTLPESLTSKLKIQRCRIYLAGQNLLTFSKYIGMDPELTTSANDPSEKDLASGIDWGTYPSSITYMLGINLSF